MLRIVHVWPYGLPSMAEIVMDRVAKGYPDGTAEVNMIAGLGNNLLRTATE
jgi:hypothetical protein